jgi:hypothetical protein
MAVGSWASTPLFTGLSNITKIVEKCIQKGNYEEDYQENRDESDADELDVKMLVSEP